MNTLSRCHRLRYRWRNLIPLAVVKLNYRVLVWTPPVGAWRFLSRRVLAWPRVTGRVGVGLAPMGLPGVAWLHPRAQLASALRVSERRPDCSEPSLSVMGHMLPCTLTNGLDSECI